MISGGNVLRLKSKVMAVLDFRGDGDCKEGPANVCFPSFSAFFKARASLPSAKEVRYSLKKCLLRCKIQLNTIDLDREQTEMLDSHNVNRTYKCLFTFDRA